ncbi:MAG: DUF3021 domain-containing protein [Lachnospiraceae bacterium]|nr:DUF3021 domain-containing protein [Lachnospiraceae bacterium]
MSGKVMKYLFGGISWGCVVSCIVNVIGTMVKGNAWFTEAGHSYAAQVAAAVLVGVAWVLPSVIYQSDRMPRVMQALIHFVIGFGVYFPTAFVMGWIPGDISTGAIFLEMLLMAAVSFVIWICFCVHYRREAKQINEQLKQKKNRGEL